MHKRHLVTSAVALVALGALAIPATADARGVHTRNVRLQDRCDPASFNAAIGPGTCMPHSGERITFAQFLAKLNPVDFGHPKWNNHPDELDLRDGDQISVTVRGGEFHTFTEVTAFEGGCVPFINGALGLTVAPTAAECGGPTGILASTGVLPNGTSTRTVSGLPAGTHFFQCMIHPWMRTVVTVGGDD